MEIEQKLDWKVKGVQLAYVLGLSLIVAAIIYFFAANWPGFDKWQKIGLSIGLIGLFYIFAFILGKVVKKHPFLSNLFLFLGCLSFGVGVALLGQIYNSHADSYMLFLVWAIPALLFSFFTKYQPFYVLTYLLLHLSFWFYLFPSSGFHYVPEAFTKWLFLGLALVNGLLYGATERKLLHSKPLGFISFVVMLLVLLGLASDELFTGFDAFVSLLFITLSISLYFYILKKQFNKHYLLLLGLSSVVFVIIKFIELVDFFDSEFVFLYTLFLPFIIVALVIIGLRKWKQQKGERQSFFKRIIVGITTGIASIIAGSSLFGISYLFFDDVSFPFFVLFATVFIVLAQVYENWDSIIRYTLLFTGFFIGVPAAIFANSWFGIIFLAVLVYAFWQFSSTAIRNITYLAMMIVLIGLLEELNFPVEGTAVTVIVINLLVFLGARMLLRQDNLKEVLANNSLFYGLLSFFILTFLFENQPFWYYFTNGSFFVFTTLFVLVSLKRSNKLHHMIFLTFWFAYIVYKYYDLVWELLHKSITFLLTGLIIIAITSRFDKVRTESVTQKAQTRRKFAAIIAVIVVQLAILGVQIEKSERLLANGELIKLKLEPVDPRSLLQGDYLVLRYSISSLKLEGGGWNERVIVGLKEKNDGVYEYSGHYVSGKSVPKDVKQKADVWITGNLKGYGNIEYGIENYFVPEGTGWDIQGKLKYSYIKVAANGDALLVDVSEE